MECIHEQKSDSERSKLPRRKKGERGGKDLPKRLRWATGGLTNPHKEHKQAKPLAARRAKVGRSQASQLEEEAKAGPGQTVPWKEKMDG
ncbi:hypothetical protein Sjap_014936 [Stephania japonica]|uniref:Uncharacterized protein n=1 Tax=Stephania japonica TaxID=461633 RepID=A0AAP0NRZ2_9MAGN